VRREISPTISRSVEARRSGTPSRAALILPAWILPAIQLVTYNAATHHLLTLNAPFVALAQLPEDPEQSGTSDLPANSGTTYSVTAAKLKASSKFVVLDIVDHGPPS
jgi:hypothetical protein